MLSSTLLLFIFTTVFGENDDCFHRNDRRDNLDTMRIIQYNVEWLFMDYCASADCPGNGCPWKNQSDSEIHMDKIINVIDELNPDLINFCEIEGINEINIIKDTHNNKYNSYLIPGQDSSTGQNVGLMTKLDPTVNLYRTEMRYEYPIIGSQCGANITGTSGVSKHYITEFIIDYMNVALISAHLLSMPTDADRCSKREAQASVLQSVIHSYVVKGYEIIMMGDFNDFDGDILDTNENKPISAVLDILKGRVGEYSGEYTLKSVGEYIEKSERYSNWWDSDDNCQTSSKYDYSMIDHILVSDAIREKIDNVFIYHKYDEYCGKYDSDHYPVVIDLII